MIQERTNTNMIQECIKSVDTVCNTLDRLILSEQERGDRMKKLVDDINQQNIKFYKEIQSIKRQQF